jgi:hypothetical protein
MGQILLIVDYAPCPLRKIRTKYMKASYHTVCPTFFIRKQPWLNPLDLKCKEIRHSGCVQLHAKRIDTQTPAIWVGLAINKKHNSPDYGPSAAIASVVRLQDAPCATP